MILKKITLLKGSTSERIAHSPDSMTTKRTVMGNEQKGGWKEYGQWQVQT
ncbi:hypothetical protein [Aureitalea marina]|nr:hypothetical protein [Aureitalea marina]